MKKMNFIKYTLLILVFVAISACQDEKKPSDDHPKQPISKNVNKQKIVEKLSGKIDVIVDTSLGSFEIQLDADKAPISVQNFLNYVDSDFYTGTIFHRVINGFMIQGGGYTKEMKLKKTNAPIQNEAHNGLSNEVGTVAMARTSVVNSATGQFFININNNTHLNHKSKTPAGYGYAVFGKVVSGMEVVNKIKNVKTSVKYRMNDVPLTPVVINSIKRK